MRIIQRGNRARIIQKGVGITRLRLELKLVGDLCNSIPVIVDIDSVQDIIAKFIEIWSACRTSRGM